MRIAIRATVGGERECRGQISWPVSHSRATRVAATGPNDDRYAVQNFSRRRLVKDTTMMGVMSTVIGVLLEGTPSAQALGFKKDLKKKRSIPSEEYSTTEDGLKIFELEEGKGVPITDGQTVTVHFDCIFRGIDAVSSRSARVLGENRIIAEPIQFVVGEPVKATKAVIGDSAGGLFAGQGGPKPPPALSTAVRGMRVGGKRSVIVPPELGYGDKGEQEIPPGASFDLRIEVLRVD